MSYKKVDLGKNSYHFNLELLKSLSDSRIIKNFYFNLGGICVTVVLLHSIKDT